MKGILAFNFLEFANHWIAWGGYPMLFGLLFACGLGLPLPEDIPLIIAGALIANDKMTWVVAGICAWCGIIGGDIVLYNIAKRYGREITKVPFIGTHVTLARIEQAEKLFDQYGTWVVAIGRLFAGIRGAMVIAAGVTRFNFTKFIITDGLAALVSGGGFMLLGYWFGNNLSWLRGQIVKYEHELLIYVLPVIVLVVIVLLWRKFQHKPKISQSMMDKIAQKVEEHK